MLYIILGVLGAVFTIALLCAAIYDCITIKRRSQVHQSIHELPNPESDSDSDSEYGFDIIDRMDILNLKYGDTCQICYEKMDGNTTIAKISGCNHAFHRPCILNWYRCLGPNQKHCPICRGQSASTGTSKLILTKVVST